MNEVKGAVKGQQCLSAVHSVEEQADSIRNQLMVQNHAVIFVTVCVVKVFQSGLLLFTIFSFQFFFFVKMKHM